MKTRLSLLFIAAFCFSVLLISPALAGKSYLAERFDVAIAVQTDGILNVTESIVFRFNGGPFTYAFRELDFANLDSIDNLQASLDGQVLAQGTQPGQVEITTGRPTRVTWHFQPVQDAAHEFSLSYRVMGAIRQEGGADTLAWRAIPEQHDYSITRSVISIKFPTGMLPLAAPELSAAEAGYITDLNGTSFTLNQIEADTPVDLWVSFPARSLAPRTPAWQAEQQARAQRTSMAIPYGLVAAAVTTLLGAAGLILARRSIRRPGNSFRNSAGQSYFAPPDNIPPALAARLTGSSVPFLGTLFDLARRGVLRIQEGPKKWGSRTFHVVRQPGSTLLQTHEQLFLGILFHKARDGGVLLNEIGSLAYNRQFSKALDQEMVLAGWRDAGRIDWRTHQTLTSIMALLLGLVVLGVGLLIAAGLYAGELTGVIAGAIMMGTGGSTGIVGLVGLIVSLAVSTLSEEGERQALAWKSFANYLHSITKGHEPVTSPVMFERYLPYAAGFGMATKWANFFHKQANTAIPEWFQGLQPAMDDGSFVAMVDAISSADSSASSVASGADGGASGGGASGAG